MGDLARYFIKDGYAENTVATTMDHLSGAEYWNPKRIKAAKYFQFAVYDYVAQLAAQIGASTLVDVGCGVGVKLKRVQGKLPALRIYGVDQEGAVAFARAHHDFGVWVADDFENPRGVDLPAEPDIIVCADVIEHVRNPDLLLNYMRRLSGPKTRIVISTPERDRMRGEDCDACLHPQHVREWNRSEFRAYLESHGFAVENSFLAPQYKFNPSIAFIRRELRRLVSGLPRNNNQVVVVRVGVE